MSRVEVIHNSWETSTVSIDGRTVCTVQIDSSVDEDTQQEYEARKVADAEFIAKSLRAELASQKKDNPHAGELNNLSDRLELLASRFSEGWHKGIEIDASDIADCCLAAAALREATTSHPQREGQQGQFTPSELKDLWRNPDALLALADDHQVHATEADAIGDFPEAVSYHEAREKELRARAEKLREEYEGTTPPETRK